MRKSRVSWPRPPRARPQRRVSRKHRRASIRAAGSAPRHRAVRRAPATYRPTTPTRRKRRVRQDPPPLPTATAPSIANPSTKIPRRRNSARSRPSSRSWLQSIIARSVCWRGSTSRLPPVSTRKRSIEPIAQLAWAQNLRPRSRQLDCQRNAVEPPADVGHDRSVLVGQGETRARRRAHDPTKSANPGFERSDEGTLVCRLAGEPQSLAARREDLDLRSTAQDEPRSRARRRRRSARSCRSTSRASSIFQRPGRGFGRITFGSKRKPKCLRNRRRNIVAVGQRCEFDEPDAVAEAVEQVRSRPARIERVLPTPPEPTSVTSRWRSMSAVMSAISASRPMNVLSCSGKLVGRRRASAAAESRPQIGGEQLKNVLGAREISEPVHAQVAQRCLRWERALHKIGR